MRSARSWLTIGLRHHCTSPGAPCLVIDRHTWRSARTLTAVRLVYPGESHKLVARFKGG